MDQSGKKKSSREAQPGTPYARPKTLINRMADSVKEILSPSIFVDLVHTLTRRSNTESAGQPGPSTSSSGGGATTSYPQNMPYPTVGTPYPPAFSSGFSGLSSFPPSNMVPISGFNPNVPSVENTPVYTHVGTWSPSVAPPLVHQSPQLYPNQPPAQFSAGLKTVEQQHGLPRIAGTEVDNFNKSSCGHPDKTRSSSTRLDISCSRSQSKESEGSQSADVSFLWSDKVKPRDVPTPSQPQPPAKRSRLAFDNSFMHSSIANTSESRDNSFRRNANHSLNESGFYPGKTAYGGASSVRRAKTLEKDQVSPAIARVQAKPMNAAGPSTVTSSTAKKILNVLDGINNMSSPLSDAKKISSYQSGVRDSPLSFTPGTYRRNQNNPERKGPPTQNIAIPTPNRALPMNRGLFGKNLLSATPGPSGLQQNPGSSTRAQETNRGPSRKMTRERQTFHAKRKDADEEIVEIPNLPTDVVLQVSNLPKFDFALGNEPKSGTPISSLAKLPRDPESTPRSSKTNPPLFGSKPNVKVNAKEQVAKKKEESPVSQPQMSSGFQFSKPISNAPPTDCSSVSPMSFTFSSPISIESRGREKSLTQAASNGQPEHAKMDFTGFKFGTSIGNKSNESATSTAKLKSREGDSKVGQGSLKQGSVLEALQGGSSSLKPGSVLEALKGASTGLRSGSVLEALTGTSPASQAKSESSSVPLSALFSQAAGQWSCPNCMVSNKPDCDTCPCCTEPRPQSAKKTSTADSSPQKSKCSTANQPLSTVPSSSISQNPPTSIANPFKQTVEKGSWDCPTCMVNNSADKTNCPCCQTKKPGGGTGVVPASTQPITATSNQPLLTELFKPAADSWECPTCLLRNEGSASTCPACQTPNPSKPKQQSPPKPSFGAVPLSEVFKKKAGSWECETCMVVNDDSTITCVACEAAKPGSSAPSTFKNPGGFQFGPNGTTFQFGAPKGFGLAASSGALAATGFSFGNTTTTSKPATDGTKPAGGFQFGAKVTSNGAPPTFTFGNTTASSDKKTANEVRFGFGSKPEEPSASALPKGGFTFGSVNAKTDPGSSQEKTSSSSIGGSTGFTFGVKPASVKTLDGKEAEVKPPPPFGFGSAASTSVAPSAMSKNNDAPTTSQTPQFSFGGSSTFGGKATSDASPALAGDSSQSKTVQAKEDSKVSFGLGNSGAVATPASSSQPSEFKGFSFSKQVNAQGLFSFPASVGQNSAASAATTTTNQSQAQSTGLFSFGKPAEKTTIAPSFTFGGTATSTAAPEAKVNVFGGDAKLARAGSLFGSSQAQPATTQSQASSQFSFATSKPLSFSSTTGTNGPTSTTTTSVFQLGGVMTTAVAPSTFTFGQSASSSTVPAQPPANKLFQFGQPAGSDTSSNKPLGAPGPFSFGAPAAATSNAQPTFSFGPGPSSGDTGGAKLGKRSLEADNEVSAKKVAKDAPLFGGLSANSSSSSSIFGASTSTVPSFGAGSGSTGFSFGQPNNSSNNSTSGLGNGQFKPIEVAPPAPSFNFSATPSFNFAGAATGPVQFSGSGSNPFNASPAPGAQRRPIKKAARRLPRK